MDTFGLDTGLITSTVATMNKLILVLGHSALCFYGGDGLFLPPRCVHWEIPQVGGCSNARTWPQKTNVHCSWQVVMEFFCHDYIHLLHCIFER